MIIFTGIHFLPLLFKPKIIQIITKVNVFLYFVSLIILFIAMPLESAITYVWGAIIYFMHAYYVLYNSNAIAYIYYGIDYKNEESRKKQLRSREVYSSKEKTSSSSRYKESSLKRSEIRDKYRGTDTSSYKKKESVFKTTSVIDGDSEEESTQRNRPKSDDSPKAGFKVVNKLKE